LIRKTEAERIGLSKYIIEIYKYRGSGGWAQKKVRKIGEALFSRSVNNLLGGEAKNSHCMTEADNQEAKPRGDYESG
jgi:hypothetical protein